MKECRICGSQNEESALFCYNCGNKIVNTEEKAIISTNENKSNNEKQSNTRTETEKKTKSSKKPVIIALCVLVAVLSTTVLLLASSIIEKNNNNTYEKVLDRYMNAVFMDFDANAAMKTLEKSWVEKALFDKAGYKNYDELEKSLENRIEELYNNFFIDEDGSVISKSNVEFEYNIYNTLENDPAIEPVFNNVDYDVDQTLMTDFDIKFSHSSEGYTGWVLLYEKNGQWYVATSDVMEPWWGDKK